MINLLTSWFSRVDMVWPLHERLNQLATSNLFAVSIKKIVIIIGLVTSREISLEEFDAPHPHPVVSTVSMQVRASNWSMLKKESAKNGSSFCSHSQCQKQISRAIHCARSLQLWWKTDQQATSTVSNLRVWHPFYPAQQNNFLQQMHQYHHCSKSNHCKESKRLTNSWLATSKPTLTTHALMASRSRHGS